VNTEQASKKEMRTPSPLNQGKGWHPWGKSRVRGYRTTRAVNAAKEFAGVVVMACLYRRVVETREIRDHGEGTSQREPREGMAR
jgi:hypothetical protein